MSDMIYNFTFPASFAGLPVTIKNDSTGEVVDTDTLGSASGGAVVHTVTLEDAAYTGRAFDATRGVVAQASGDLDIPASIGAGGGVVLDGANYLFEINTPATVNIASGSLEWDTAPDGITPGPIIVGLPAGLYVADLEVYFTQPADDVALTAKFECMEFICRSGPYTIYSTGSDNAFTLRASGLMRVQSLSSNVSAHFSGAVVNGGAITTLDVDYASLILTPISN